MLRKPNLPFHHWSLEIKKYSEIVNYKKEFSVFTGICFEIQISTCSDNYCVHENPAEE